MACFLALLSSLLSFLGRGWVDTLGRSLLLIICIRSSCFAVRPFLGKTLRGMPVFEDRWICLGWAGEKAALVIPHPTHNCSLAVHCWCSPTGHAARKGYCEKGHWRPTAICKCVCVWVWPICMGAFRGQKRHQILWSWSSHLMCVLWTQLGPLKEQVVISTVVLPFQPWKWYTNNVSLTFGSYLMSCGWLYKLEYKPGKSSRDT